MCQWLKWKVKRPSVTTFTNVSVVFNQSGHMEWTISTLLHSLVKTWLRCLCLNENKLEGHGCRLWDWYTSRRDGFPNGFSCPVAWQLGGQVSSTRLFCFAMRWGTVRNIAVNMQTRTWSPPKWVRSAGLKLQGHGIDRLGHKFLQLIYPFSQPSGRGHRAAHFEWGLKKNKEYNFCCCNI